MIGSLFTIIIALSMIVVLIFAYLEKNKLARNVALVMLAAVALTMAFNGFASLISDVGFLDFLENLFRSLADLVVYVEVGLIIYLLVTSKGKFSFNILTIAILAYVVLVLLDALGVV